MSQQQKDKDRYYRLDDLMKAAHIEKSRVLADRSLSKEKKYAKTLKLTKYEGLLMKKQFALEARLNVTREDMFHMTSGNYWGTRKR